VSRADRGVRFCCPSTICLDIHVLDLWDWDVSRFENLLRSDLCEEDVD
jgi:hypothetical protein